MVKALQLSVVYEFKQANEIFVITNPEKVMEREHISIMLRTSWTHCINLYPRAFTRLFAIIRIYL